jgi:hypothetical protein
MARLSRRGFLQKCAAGAGGAAVPSGCATTPPTRGHISKAEARYQDRPKGISRCGFCKHFHSPDLCEVVAEPVSPRGYCRFYAFL